MLGEVSGVEDVGDKQGGVTGKVAEGNVCIASLFKLVLCG